MSINNMNIKKNELAPFFKKSVVNNDVNKGINLLNILSDANNSLPLIPGMYFGENIDIKNIVNILNEESNVSSNVSSIASSNVSSNPFNHIKPVYSSRSSTISNLTSNEINSITTTNNNKKKIVVSYDNLGSKIISIYYNVMNSINKLEMIKTFILTILNDNRKDFESIKVSKNKYNLLKKNLIFNFKEKLSDNFISALSKEQVFSKTLDKLSQTFKDSTEKISTSPNNEIKAPTKTTFPTFIQGLTNNKYNLLSNTIDKSENPYFLNIFQNEFKGKSKSFYYKLFQEYINERKNLLKYVKDNYGLLAFSFMFDLNHTFNYNENQNKSKSKNNLANYQIIESNNITSSINNSYKIGDKVNILGNNGTIIGIDFTSNPEKPYKIKLDSANSANGASSIKNYSKSNITKSMDNKIKPTLLSKIHNFDMLYTNFVSKQEIQLNYTKNINKIYADFYKSLNNYISGNMEFNLLNIITNNLDLDINLFKLVFNYVDKSIFYKAVDIHYEIKDFISSKINTFESYYESYILWYNKLHGVVSLNTDILFQDNIPANSFQLFLKSILEKEQ